MSYKRKIAGGHCWKDGQDASVPTRSGESAPLPHLILIFAKKLIGVGVIGFALTATPCQAESCGKNWKSVYPEAPSKPLKASLNDVIWTGNEFVAVGDSGTILTSPDGVGWATQPSGTKGSLRAIAAQSDLLVAVGDTIVTREPGARWERQRAKNARGSNYVGLDDVIWDEQQFIAVGSEIYTSPDGKTWTNRIGYDTPFSILGSLAKGNNLLVTSVALVPSPFLPNQPFRNPPNVLFTSPDGIVWNSQTIALDQTYYQCGSVIWNGSQFLISGCGKSALTSPGGLNWTRHDYADPELLPPSPVIWTGGQYLGPGNDSGAIKTSTDGVSWVSQTSSTGPWLLSHPHSLASNGKLYVAVGDEISTSADGYAWTSRAWNSSIGFSSAAWNGSLFVVIGNSGMMTSPDGLSWTQRLPPITGLRDILWSGNQFIVVGNRSVASSSDGINWTSTEIPEATSAFNAVTQGRNQYVAVTNNAEIFASSDGATWTKQETDLSGNSDFKPLQGVAWNGNRFVAVGHYFYTIGHADAYNSVVMTSENGSNWRTIIGPETKDSDKYNFVLSGVAWGNNTFIAVGEKGRILSSPDGLTWRKHKLRTNATLSGIQWDGSEFVVFGEKGLILTSADGKVWKTRPSRTSATLSGLVKGNGHILAVGDNKTILSSQCH